VNIGAGGQLRGSNGRNSSIGNIIVMGGGSGSSSSCPGSGAIGGGSNAGESSRKKLLGIRASTPFPSGITNDMAMEYNHSLAIFLHPEQDIFVELCNNLTEAFTRSPTTFGKIVHTTHAIP
jgi:hypothetical protein